MTHDTSRMTHDRVSRPDQALAHQSQSELGDIVDTKFSLMYDTFQPPQNAGFENLKQKQGKLQTCYPSAVSECWADLFTGKFNVLLCDSRMTLQLI